ncbi:unnamed protein product [Gulo gulo]|uniref:Uncharacterized protein n=1 Tax=Gulo gulo TaxID=48420 RepID=A0A9X9LZ07_GULGU|nr:unnamed protein product [Gulo gulo]
MDGAKMDLNSSQQDAIQSCVHTADPISQEEPIKPVCGIWAVPGASH